MGFSWACVVLGVWAHFRLHHTPSGNYDSELVPQFGLWIWQIAILFSALALSAWHEVSDEPRFVVGPSLLDRRP